MKYEIRNSRLEDIEGLKLLWANTFHDTREYIDGFFAATKSMKNIFVAVYNNVPIAMMFMLPATLRVGQCMLKTGYVYAVATDNHYRGRGIMREVEHYMCGELQQRHYRIVTLVPSSSSLFTMYQKIGYSTAFYSARTLITPKVSKCTNLKECTSDYFLTKRQEMLVEPKSALEFNDNYQQYRFDVLKKHCDIYRYQDNQADGYIVGKQTGNEYTIFETSLAHEPLSKAMHVLTNQYCKLRKITLVGKTGKRYPYGMIKPLDNKVDIIGIVNLNPYMNLMLE